MRISRTGMRRIGIGLSVTLAGLLLVVVLAGRQVIPSLIVSRLEGQLGGKVRIDDWWLSWGSSGLTGLKVHEGRDVSSPIWLSVPRVTSDLTIGKVLRGQFAPGRLVLKGPELALRVSRQGALLTHLAMQGKGAGSASRAVPLISVEGGTVGVQQESRPAFVVKAVSGGLTPDAEGVVVAIQSKDPSWGPLEANGRFDAAFQTGRIDLKTTSPIVATPEMAASIPFVPEGVWSHVSPRGKLDLGLTTEVDRRNARPIQVRTAIDFRGTTVQSGTLEMTATETTGRVVVEGGVVRLEKVAGLALDGRVAANGTLDFSRAPPRFDIGLDMEHISVVKTPRSWQLDEAGVTGFLTGKAKLVVLLAPGGVDLSGTTGDAVVEGGTIQGLPFKSMKLVMDARGTDLRYDSPKGPPSTGPTSEGRPRTKARESLAIRAILRDLAIRALVTLQAQEPRETKEAEKPKEATRKGGIHLPRSLTTKVEMEDVDLAKLISRAEFLLGFPFPLPITGRLSVKAEATIPLGKLRSLKEYAFHGDLTLTKASAYNVDLGHLSAHVDMSEGTLALSDIRGRLVDHPNGGPNNPPRAVGEETPRTGPLPAGGFRGTLRAGFVPIGQLTAHFEGVEVPLGEIAAPALPRPTPLSGLASLKIDASVDLNATKDPSAWTISGQVRSRAIQYKDRADLDAVAATFDLKKGHLEVTELTARLREKPLNGRLEIDLKPPHAFQGHVNLTSWDVAEVLDWVPRAPKPAPVMGLVSARADAKGTLNPLVMRTEGQGQFDRFVAGPIALGTIPFSWSTPGETVVVLVHDAHPFGGRLKAEAHVPLGPGKSTTGSATIEAIDTARLSEAIPGGGLKLTGKASGQGTFSLASNVSSLDARLRLSAPDLTVQGIPADQVHASVQARKGELGYEIAADSLGGKITFKGAFPLAAAAAAKLRSQGELRAVGFTLGQVWNSLGLTGLISRVTGRGAIDANVRSVTGGQDAGVFAHGLVEVRDLRWGTSAPIGQLRGVLAMTPTVWRIDLIRGELLGGLVTGFLWGTSPPAHRADDRPPPVPVDNQSRFGFNVRVDRAPLQTLLATLHLHGIAVQGFGTLQVVGTFGDALHANGDFHVPRARLAGLPLTDLRLPAELITHGRSAAGVLRVRRWSARLSGGQIHGDAWFRTGSDRAFQSDLTISGLDLESIARVESDAKRPASGQISGRIIVKGPDPSLPRRYRGSFHLNLDDASLVALPVLRELDRFLGAARGGVFENGEAVGTIINRQFNIETLTLVGRVAQLHATGTVGFDGQVNLEVLVNTSQIINQTGQALVSAIPGLSGRLGRNRDAFNKVGGFLSARLLKFRVTGTVRNPSVVLDPSISPNDNATSFFSGVLNLPVGQGR
ncbi:MAG: hypothetical protein NVSMB9_16380 [Isosphaeraceae bacterium]